jgi:hypothetical protein
MNENQTDPHNNPEPIQVLLTVLGLVAALIGVILLYVTPIDPKVVIPAAFWIVLVGAALFAAALVLRPSSRASKVLQNIPKNPAISWISIAVLLSAAAALAAYLFEKQDITGYLPVITIWLLGAVCYLLAFFSPNSLRRNWKQWFVDHRTELILVGVILVMGVGLRFYKLGELPHTINGDEGRIGIFARESTLNPNANPYSLRENLGGLYLQSINAMVIAFGSNAFSLRLLPAIGGSLALLTTYLFTRYLTNKNVALIAMFLLMVSHTHLHFSRTVAVTYIQDTWLIPLELYLFISGVEKRSSWRTALSGILLAIHMSIYISAMIVVGILIAFLLVAFFWLKKSIRPAWRQVLVFWAGFLIVLIPEGSYILRQSNQFMSRFSAEGTLSSGWLAKEIVITGKSAATILIERVAHAFLSLIYYPAFEFYGSYIPIISMMTAVLFIMGLAYILIRARSLKMLLLNGYFWGVTAAVGLFAIPPSADSYRMLAALPAAIIIAAIGLDQIMTRLGVGMKARRFHFTTITAVIMISLFIINIWAYFFDFIGQCRYGGDTQTRFASYVGNYAQGIPREIDIYLLSNETYQIGTHDSVNYLAGNRKITNIDDPIENFEPAPGEIIIANPDRIDELQTWARNHPGGELKFIYDCQNQIMLIYKVP